MPGVCRADIPTAWQLPGPEQASSGPGFLTSRGCNLGQPRGQYPEHRVQLPMVSWHQSGAREEGPMAVACKACSRPASMHSGQRLKLLQVSLARHAHGRKGTALLPGVDAPQGPQQPAWCSK